MEVSMKNKRNFLLASSLAVLLSFMGTAHADDAATTTTAAARKEPIAPKHVILADGRIDEWIGTDQVAGYGIGDPIKVTIAFELTPNSMFRARHPDLPPPKVLPPLPAAAAADKSQSPGPNGPGNAAANVAKIQMPTMLELPLINTEPLKMAAQARQTTDQPSDMEVYKGASVDTYALPDGRWRIVVTMVLTQYVTTQKEADGTTKHQADAAMDFGWAVSRLPDGQPDWHSDRTPELTFGIHETADPNQTLLIEGDLSAKVSPVAAAANALFLSLPFAIPALVVLGIAAFGRVLRRRELSRNERTWLAIGEVLKQAHAAGNFSVGHYQQIFGILREHLHFQSITTTQALEQVATGQDTAGKPIDVAAATYLFHQETVLFDPNKRITSDDRGQLFRNIATLVPVEAAELMKFLSLAGDLIPSS
jgi:hypothetical protein